MNELREPTSFSTTWALFGLCGLGGSGLRCGWFRVFGAREPPAAGEWLRRGEKGHPKCIKNSKNTRKNMKIKKTSRLFEAHLGIFSGLVDQGLVARCFTVLQGASVPSYHQQSLVRKKRNDKVKTLGNLSLFVTRQQMQVTIPNWVVAREERVAQFLSHDW